MEPREQEPDETFVRGLVRVDLGRRVLYLGGDVDANMAIRAVSALEKLDVTDGDIRVVLNSEGGSEQDGYAIFDAITMCRNKVVIHGYGNVLSITAAIFQAGDERLMSPNALLMVHHGNVAGEETMKQDRVVELAEQIQKDNQRYYDILSSASGQPQEAIEAFCREETYFTATEAVAQGFADGILKPSKEHWAKKPKAKKRSKK